MNLKRATISVLVLGSIIFASQIASACDPNEECSVCLLHNPFGGCIQSGNNPICEARKAICQQCASIKAAATGLDMACVTCVMVSSAANPACVAACGSAADAEAVAATGGCD
jgi:hypothetical protein